MTFETLQITAFALEASGPAAEALSRPLTLTLQLPAAAQASEPSERPLGSVVRIEVDGKPLEKDQPAERLPLPMSRPALLTLTF